jgi:hypothetical protein
MRISVTIDDASMMEQGGCGVARQGRELVRTREWYRFTAFDLQSQASSPFPSFLSSLPPLLLFSFSLLSP